MDILRLNFHRFSIWDFPFERSQIDLSIDRFSMESAWVPKRFSVLILYLHYWLYVTLYFTQAMPITLHQLQPDMAKLLIDQKLLIFYQSGLNLLPNYHFAVLRPLVRRSRWVLAEDASPESLQVAYKLWLARVIAAKDESWPFGQGLICSTSGLFTKIGN